ncbi:hypothetical protein BLL52_0944 [Rhodoferax antarcticus ANT.BR]|uniref:Uncharacterized protein n=1 Tax=Rhodoferax antarcticus ANT.BR TaxID=1111071 RepID=A0A1Q8YIP2_9BURK|nr:hypothetical protein BLL52_0944 [Rhodoferax antarcticus ANT.BR]
MGLGAKGATVGHVRILPAVSPYGTCQCRVHVCHRRRRLATDDRLTGLGVGPYNDALNNLFTERDALRHDILYFCNW